MWIFVVLCLVAIAPSPEVERGTESEVGGDQIATTTMRFGIAGINKKNLKNVFWDPVYGDNQCSKQALEKGYTFWSRYNERCYGGSVNDRSDNVLTWEDNPMWTSGVVAGANVVCYGSSYNSKGTYSCQIKDEAAPAWWIESAYENISLDHKEKAVAKLDAPFRVTSKEAALEAETGVGDNDTYNYDLEQPVLKWIAGVLGQPGLFDGVSGPDKFWNKLNDGVILCRLMNQIKPGSIRKINTNTMIMPFLIMENLGFVNQAMRNYGVKPNYLFHTVDLYEKQNLNQVLIGLRELGTLATKNGIKPEISIASTSEESIGHGRHGHHGKGGHYGHHGYHHSGYGGGYGGNGNQQSGVCADNIGWSDSWGSCATWKHSGWCANCQNGPNWKNWWHGSFRQTGAFYNCKASCGCCTPEPATPVVTPPAPVVRAAAAPHKNRAASEASVGKSPNTTTNSFGLIALCGVCGVLGYAAQWFFNKEKMVENERLTELI